MIAARGAPVALVASGVAAVGVAFGLARYGYGLLLPELRAAFELDSAALGAIASGAYVAYLAATPAAAWLARRAGARATILAGGCVAVLGMALIAAAPVAAVLATGVVLAGASAGLVYPPFSDLIAQHVDAARRGRALAAVSAGTGWGVALAAPVALVLGADWRAAWAIFAAIALASVMLSACYLPSARVVAPAAAPRISPSWLVCPRSGRLLAGAFVVGLGSSVYWTFAVDYAVSAGSHSAAAGRTLFLLVGLASIGGALAGDLVRRIGGRLAFAASLAALVGSFVLLAALGQSLAATLASGALFGCGYNLVLAIQAIWSGRVFSERPSAGLSAVMFALGAGLLAGPALGGALADAIGLTGVLYGAAATVAVAILLAPRETLETRGTPRAAAAVDCEPAY